MGIAQPAARSMPVMSSAICHKDLLLEVLEQVVEGFRQGGMSEDRVTQRHVRELAHHGELELRHDFATFDSEVLVLGAIDPEKGVVLLRPDRDVEPGDRIG